MISSCKRFCSLLVPTTSFQERLRFSSIYTSDGISIKYRHISSCTSPNRAKDDAICTRLHENRHNFNQTDNSQVQGGPNSNTSFSFSHTAYSIYSISKRTHTYLMITIIIICCCYMHRPQPPYLFHLTEEIESKKILLCLRL